jgi:hypothetical protein
MVSISQLRSIEHNNDASVNVFTIDEAEKSVFHLRISERQEAPEERCFDLLLLEEGERRHFAFIKALSRLVRAQVSTHRKTHHICRACLGHYTLEEKLNEHRRSCAKFKEVKVVMPSEERRDNFAEFKYKDHYDLILDFVSNTKVSPSFSIDSIITNESLVVIAGQSNFLLLNREYLKVITLQMML